MPSLSATPTSPSERDDRRVFMVANVRLEVTAQPVKVLTHFDHVTVDLDERLEDRTRETIRHGLYLRGDRFDLLPCSVGDPR